MKYIPQKQNSQRNKNVDVRSENKIGINLLFKRQQIKNKINADQQKSL